MKKIRVRQLQIIIIKILLFFMPLHYVLFSLVLGNIKILSLWRDVLIILLLLLSIKDRKLKINAFSKLLLMIITMIILFCLTNINSTSINIARTYIMPMVVYLSVWQLNLSKDEYEGIIRTLWISGVLNAIYGLYQAFVLGAQFLIGMGYSCINGRLASPSFYIHNNWSQQRVTGTFVGPNNCGCFLAIILILLIAFRNISSMNKKLYYLGIAIVAVGLVGTLSRSAWVGTIVAVFMLSGLKKTKKTGKSIFIFCAVIVGVFVIDYCFLNQKITSIAYSQIINTLSGSDASARSHLRDLIYPIEEILIHPFGYKFGTNGSFALSAYSVDDVHLVESSIYTICYEFGLIGALFFFSPYILTIIKKNNKVFRIPAAIAACLMIVYILLPSIQAYEQPFYFFLTLGLCTGIYKNSIKNI